MLVDYITHRLLKPYDYNVIFRYFNWTINESSIALDSHTYYLQTRERTVYETLVRNTFIRC